VGDARFDRAVGRGRRDRGGVNERASHRFGARAELAAARLLGIRWPATVDVFTSVPDLPPDIEVRGSRSSRDLKLRDKDMLSERRYVVVVNDGNRWRFTGWLRGTEAASMGLVAQRRRADLAPAFWVPADRLHSPGEFVRAT
jgi:hypothetical protein